MALLVVNTLCVRVVKNKSSRPRKACSLSNIYHACVSGKVEDGPFLSAFAVCGGVEK